MLEQNVYVLSLYIPFYIILNEQIIEKLIEFNVKFHTSILALQFLKQQKDNLFLNISIR